VSARTPSKSPAAAAFLAEPPAKKKRGKIQEDPDLGFTKPNEKLPGENEGEYTFPELPASIVFLAAFFEHRGREKRMNGRNTTRSNVCTLRGENA